MIGRVLAGRWTVVKELGVGGTAAVYEAVHRNGRRVAIKVLHPELLNERVPRKRFAVEGFAANRVGHPNAVAIFDDGVEPDGTVFLVMELLEGYSAAKSLREGRNLPVLAVASIALAVLDVLAAAHDQGIVHRDVKPGNIFLTRNGEIKLLDFGVAHVGDRLGISVITQAGSAVGTPAFMAPEQAAGRLEDVDMRTDVWALGATMFQLLTQRLVHDVTSSRGAAAIAVAATRPAPLLRSVVPNISPAFALVVDRALSFHRAERWPNARAMRQALLEACPKLLPSKGGTPLAPETAPEAMRSQRSSQLAAVKGTANHTRRAWNLGLLLLFAVLLLPALAYTVRHSLGAH
jgi:serine/threonine-protein kinase